MAFDFYIKTQQDLIDAVKEYGIVPYFENSIPGFSIEEHAAPSAWFDSEQEGIWEWKGPVIRKTGCAYGKFFEGFFNDGYASLKDKALYDLIEKNGPLLSKELKVLGNYRKGGAKGFDTCINRLQAQCFVLISNFVYMKDRFGREYGWGVAEYAAPEQFMGPDFTDDVYSRDPKESFERLTAHICGLFPSALPDDIRRFLTRA